jgi:hypothetical protein
MVETDYRSKPSKECEKLNLTGQLGAVPWI